MSSVSYNFQSECGRKNEGLEEKSVGFKEPLWEGRKSSCMNCSHIIIREEILS